MQVTWTGRQAAADARYRAVEAAAVAMRDGYAGPGAALLDKIERHRADLAVDKSVFDEVEGHPVTVSRMARIASSNAEQCRFLHVLTQELRPATVVEMGTAVGISGASIASALPAGARMWTVDLREASAVFARRLFERVGVDVTIVTGRFADVLEEVLAEAAPLDLLFVDGHHNEQATLQYTDQAWPFLSQRSLVVFDDIRWSDGMYRAWEVLREQARWEFAADFGNWGVCAVGAAS